QRPLRAPAVRPPKGRLGQRMDRRTGYEQAAAGRRRAALQTRRRNPGRVTLRKGAPSCKLAWLRAAHGENAVDTGQSKARSCQAVEKGPPASLRSIASLQRISKYAYARRFLARLASGPF